MFLKWMLPFLLVISANVQARSFNTEIIEYIDEVKVIAFINEDDITAAAQWDPMTQAPPLTIADVIRIIKKQATDKHDLDKLTVIEFELKEIPNHKNYWHYLVKVKVNDKSDHSADFYVVLMNGKLISAIR